MKQLKELDAVAFGLLAKDLQTAIETAATKHVDGPVRYIVVVCDSSGGATFATVDKSMVPEILTDTADEFRLRRYQGS